MEPDHYGTSI